MKKFSSKLILLSLLAFLIPNDLFAPEGGQKDKRKKPNSKLVFQDLSGGSVVRQQPQQTPSSTAQSDEPKGQETPPDSAAQARMEKMRVMAARFNQTPEQLAQQFAAQQNQQAKPSEAPQPDIRQSEDNWFGLPLKNDPTPEQQKPTPILGGSSIGTTAKGLDKNFYNKKFRSKNNIPKATAAELSILRRQEQDKLKNPRAQSYALPEFYKQEDFVPPGTPVMRPVTEDTYAWQKAEEDRWADIQNEQRELETQGQRFFDPTFNNKNAFQDPGAAFDYLMSQRPPMTPTSPTGEQTWDGQ